MIFCTRFCTSYQGIERVLFLSTLILFINISRNHFTGFATDLGAVNKSIFFARISNSQLLNVISSQCIKIENHCDDVYLGLFRYRSKDDDSYLKINWQLAHFGECIRRKALESQNIIGQPMTKKWYDCPGPIVYRSPSYYIASSLLLFVCFCN